MKSRGFVDIDDLPKDYVEAPEPSQRRQGPSRNDIFNTSQRITKPATKMTQDEINALKAGLSPPSCSTPEPSDSITVPVHFGNLVAPNPIPHQAQPPVPNAFLKNIGPSRERLFKSPLEYEHESRDRADSFSTGVSSRSEESGNPITHAGTYDSIQLSFLPTRRNFVGQGRYAEVYRGYYRVLDDFDPMKPMGDLRVCAVKRMRVTEEAQVIGFTESAILRRVANLHPNIISCICVKDENSLDSSRQSWLDNVENGPSRVLSPRLLLVLDLYPNGDLWSWFVKNRAKIGKNLWLKWAMELSGALTAVHSAGVVHHDIKPHNILLSDVLDVCLSDFGNAAIVPEISELEESFIESTPLATPRFTNLHDRCASPLLSVPPDVPKRSPSPFIIPGRPSSPFSQSLTKGTGRGTLAYTAPEMLTIGAAYSFPVDVYSLGVTLYMLISGMDPFSLARSSTHLILCIQRGFFESGTQGLGGSGRPGEGGIIGDPMDGNWRFQSSESVALPLVELILKMTRVDPSLRPTAKQVQEALETFF